MKRIATLVFTAAIALTPGLAGASERDPHRKDHRDPEHRCHHQPEKPECQKKKHPGKHCDKPTSTDKKADEKTQCECPANEEAL